TFLLIEAPLLLELLPQQLQLIPLFIAVLGPGVVIAWKETAALRDAALTRQAMIRLATTSLVYCQIATVFWLTDFDVPDYMMRLSDFSLAYMSVPLLLLLVAAHHPDRTRAVTGATDSSAL